MNTQTIFQAGNSRVVSIPKSLLEELNFKLGQKVNVTKLDDESIVIKKVKTTPLSSAKTTSEFKKWLSDVLEEDAEVLDELAVR
ncbi:MAG: AbrB/MazE/SpoVT family DNA-binding domain-containing protein [bacterium]|nr:AbrB/MazE/SpoVT family DNA-binding domain-containing protein [bacterium]